MNSMTRGRGGIPGAGGGGHDQRRRDPSDAPRYQPGKEGPNEPWQQLYDGEKLSEQRTRREHFGRDGEDQLRMTERWKRGRMQPVELRLHSSPYE